MILVGGEPKVKKELLSETGNMPVYEVFGKEYEVNLDVSDDFVEEGVASWYGMKFHGRKTSSGEIFDVYRMTAAHPFLPLPSYVRVTNLNNERSLIVKVNDRGPFHEGRTLDLSWGAACKLGFAKKGIAPVKIDLLQKPLLPESLIKKDTEEISSKISYVKITALTSLKEAFYVRSWIDQTFPEFSALTIVKKDAENSQFFQVHIGPMRHKELLLMEMFSKKFPLKQIYKERRN